MIEPAIVYLKNRRTQQFEHATKKISTLTPTRKGYQITFSNGATYNYSAKNVHCHLHAGTQEEVYIYENGQLNSLYNAVDDYGAYFIFRKGTTYSQPIRKHAGIKISKIKTETKQAKNVIAYFKEMLFKTGGENWNLPSGETETKEIKQISAEISLKALHQFDLSDTSSALSHYLEGKNPEVGEAQNIFIYPFGCNESQKRAVEAALTSSMSCIEGPPGTGKTQTILNIIANLVFQGKSVVIASNNNSAVGNIREKLEKYGYGDIVAFLGNNQNRQTFFEKLCSPHLNIRCKRSKEQMTAALNQVKEANRLLTACFEKSNRLATLKAQYSEATLEYEHVKADQPLDETIITEIDRKFHCKWTFKKILAFKKQFTILHLKKRLSFFYQLRLIFQYRLLSITSLLRYKEYLYTYSNHKFYRLYIAQLKKEIDQLETWLASHHEADHLKALIDTSKEIFEATLYQRYDTLQEQTFTMQNYRTFFDNFIQHYPVVLSSTLSLRTCIPKDYLFDKVIIDEASQVDIIKSAICFSCAQSAVVVGDSRQLNPIIDNETQKVATELQQKYHLAPAYDYVQKNILTSLKTLYGANIQTILLKEHYRCHPAIIGFCNKKYYDNQLIIMTKNQNTPFKIINTQIAGGRDLYNQRQIDETDAYIRTHYADKYTEVGVIAPYRNHANRLQQQLPQEVEADTIHRFQGREKRSIIFNTVSKQIHTFIDDSHLINVAVSRAIDEFIMVKPSAMPLPHGTNIGDLVRYINYTTCPEERTIKASICSVFDLLYQEYNKELQPFLSSHSHVKGSPAEVIIDRLLNKRILLQDPAFSSVDVVREYKLSDLVRDPQQLSNDERLFIYHNARLDFLLYSKIDKSPILGIEVDGVSFHDNEIQQARDQKKNHILEIIGLPLLRLSTEGHHEEKRIVEALRQAMGEGE